MDSSKSRNMGDDKQQSDKGWIDDLWNQAHGISEAEMDQAEDDTLNEERRLTIFKLKRRMSIPRAYFGPLFHENYTEFCVKIQPMTYLDVCEPAFQKLACLATSFHFSLADQNREVQLHATSETVKAIVEGILLAQFENSLITIQLEHRKADQGEKDDDGNLYFFPTSLNKATFKIDAVQMKSAFGGKQAHGESEKQRSLFLQNLPESADAKLLQILFPVCVRCDTVKSSNNVKSAILLTQSIRTAIQLLASIKEFEIDGKNILMATTEATKSDAEQLIGLTEAATAEAQQVNGLLQSDDAQSASSCLLEARARNESAARQAQAAFIKSQKPAVKWKSPSDFRRNQARKKKLDQRIADRRKAVSSLPTDHPADGQPTEPPFPAGLRPAPPFPGEIELLNTPTAVIRDKTDVANRDMSPAEVMPPPPPYPGDYNVMNMTDAGYRGALAAHAYDAAYGLTQVPPFPDELRYGGASGVKYPSASRQRPPGVSRFRNQSKIERDKKRMTAYIERKKREAAEAEAGSSTNANTLSAPASDQESHRVISTDRRNSQSEQNSTSGPQKQQGTNHSPRNQSQHIQQPGHNKQGGADRYRWFNKSLTSKDNRASGSQQQVIQFQPGRDAAGANSTRRGEGSASAAQHSARAAYDYNPGAQQDENFQRDDYLEPANCVKRRNDEEPDLVLASQSFPARDSYSHYYDYYYSLAAQRDDDYYGH